MLLTIYHRIDSNACFKKRKVQQRIKNKPDKQSKFPDTVFLIKVWRKWQCRLLSPVKFWPEMDSICETTYLWEMIAILGRGFISCLISSSNRNLQLLIYSFWGFYKMCDREAATTWGCHLGYTDTLNYCSLFKIVIVESLTSTTRFIYNRVQYQSGKCTFQLETENVFVTLRTIPRLDQ